MSLIIDALKKAQQLRLKGSEGSPILKYPHPDKKRGRGSKKQWILVGAGLICLGILLFILLKTCLSTLGHPNQSSHCSLGEETFRPMACRKYFYRTSKGNGESAEG